jgi:ribosomal subunit interface protein
VSPPKVEVEPPQSYGTTDAARSRMHAYITARHFDLTERIRAHVEQHIIQPIEAHADAHDLNRVEVQLSQGQREERFTCHVMVQLPAHRDVNVTEHHRDLFAAIDLAEKRLLRATFCWLYFWG